MSRNRQVGLALMAIGAICLGISFAQTSLLAITGNNLVDNGGFESGDNNWNLYLDGNTATWTISSDAHSGSSSGKLTATSVAVGSAVAIQQSVSPVVGETYTLSLWYKVQGSFMFYVAIADANWVKIDWWRSQLYLSETSEWTNAELTVGPISSSYAHSWVSFDLDSAGEILVDDVTIVPYDADGGDDGETGDGMAWQYGLFGGICVVGGGFLYSRKRD